MSRLIGLLRKVDRDTWLTMSFLSFWTFCIIWTRG